MEATEMMKSRVVFGGDSMGEKMGKAWFKHINVHCSCNWLITIRLVSPQIVGLFMFLLYDRILQHISTNGLVVSKHDYQPQNVECGSRGSVPKTWIHFGSLWV